MVTDRYKKALNALHSDTFKFVLQVLIDANEADMAEEDAIVRGWKKKVGISDDMPPFIDVFSTDRDSFSVWMNNHPCSFRVKNLMKALKDPFVDATTVVMYAGRDMLWGYIKEPLDNNFVDQEFAEQWEELDMDRELFAREVVAAKAPLSEYLRAGIKVFCIE